MFSTILNEDNKQGNGITKQSYFIDFDTNKQRSQFVKESIRKIVKCLQEDMNTPESHQLIQKLYQFSNEI